MDQVNYENIMSDIKKWKEDIKIDLNQQKKETPEWWQDKIILQVLSGVEDVINDHTEFDVPTSLSGLQKLWQNEKGKEIILNAFIGQLIDDCPGDYGLINDANLCKENNCKQCWFTQ